MVCPYKSPEQRKKQQEAAQKAEAAGAMEDVQQLLKDLASPDPAVRRRAAVMFEINSLGAQDMARDWRENEG